MARMKDSSPKETFVVDRKYLQSQAREAFAMFVAPLSGVYTAVVGSEKVGSEASTHKKRA